MKFKISFIYVIGICLLLPLCLTFCKKDKTPKIESANSLLSAAQFDKLRVEIQSMSGFEPSQATLDNLKKFLEARLNKPGGIAFLQTTIGASGKSSYSISEIAAIEKNNRTPENTAALSVYFLFLDGDFSENVGSSKVLGVAYSSSAMAIFEKTIKEFSGGIGKPTTTTLETTVINHEFGHIMGLVNNGTSMQTSHQDEPNGRHCNNKSCLMYYTAETSDIIGNLLGNNIPELDANCINDLKANGGK